MNTFSGIFTIQEFTKHSDKFAYGTVVHVGDDKKLNLEFRAKLFGTLVDQAEAKWKKDAKIFASGELEGNEFKGKNELVFVIRQFCIIEQEEVRLSRASMNTKDSSLRF